MPNSNQGAGRFHKWLPQWLKAILFLSLCICITAALNYGFIPPSSVRINLHNLRNGETYDTIFIGTSHGQYGIDPFSVDAASGGSSVSLCMADAIRTICTICCGLPVKPSRRPALYTSWTPHTG